MTIQATKIFNRNVKVTEDAKFIGSFDNTGVVPNLSQGGMVKMGTSSLPLTSATTGTGNFLQYYFSSPATSGDVRGIYNRLYLTGAGAAGESLRTYTTVNAAADTTHGIHASLGFGSSGSVTGLGVAGRNTLHVPNAALSGGTYACIQ